MAAPLITKTKEAFRAFLADLDSADLADYAFVRGMRAGLLTLPSVSVTVGSLAPVADIQNENLFEGELGIVIRTRAEFDESHKAEDAEDAHDAAVQAILTGMIPDAVRTFCNSENVTDRPAILSTGFHVDEFPYPRLENFYDAEAAQFVTALHVRVTVMATDADA